MSHFGANIFDQDPPPPPPPKPPQRTPPPAPRARAEDASLSRRQVHDDAPEAEFPAAAPRAAAGESGERTRADEDERRNADDEHDRAPEQADDANQETLDDRDAPRLREPQDQRPQRRHDQPRHRQERRPRDDDRGRHGHARAPHDRPHHTAPHPRHERGAPHGPEDLHESHEPHQRPLGPRRQHRRELRERHPGHGPQQHPPHGEHPSHHAQRPAPSAQRADRPRAEPLAPKPTQRVGILLDFAALSRSARQLGGEVSFRKLLRGIAAERPVVHAVCWVPPGTPAAACQSLAASGFQVHEQDADTPDAVDREVRTMAGKIDVLVLAPAENFDTGLVDRLAGSDLRLESADFVGTAPSGLVARKLGRECMFIP